MQFEYKKPALFGILIWLFTYCISIALWTLQKNFLGIFSSLLSVSIVYTTLFASMSYFREIKEHYHEIAVRVSSMWFVTNLLLGYFGYVLGPFKMSLVEYISEIGFIYVVILLIPNGLGCMGKQVCKQILK